MNDMRLETNLRYLKEVTSTAKAIIDATKEKDINEEDKRMFSKGTIERYTQKAKDIENNDEEMEIG